MVEYGKTAVVSYCGTLEDGTIFDSTDGVEPLEFVVGSGAIIHGFDKAVSQMNIGDEVEITIPAKDAYGEYSDQRIDHKPMYSIPNAKDIKVGKTFYFVTQEGMYFPAKVTEINEGMATIDFNHPLAGKDLNFKIKLLDIKESGGMEYPCFDISKLDFSNVQ